MFTTIQENRLSNSILFYVLIAFFVLSFSIGVFFEQYWVLLIAPVLFIGYYSLRALDKIFLFTAFLVPFSINLEQLEFGLGLSVPAEPLLAGITLLYILTQITAGTISKKSFYNPVTIAVMLYLGWMLITAIMSEKPLISIKFFIAKLWFIVPCYFLAISVFKSVKKIHFFMWLQIIALIVVIAYTIVRMAGVGFNKETAHWIMQPFYKDHAMYATAIAFLIPYIVGQLFTNKSFLQKSLIFFVMLVLFSGVLFSYTRATWLSLIVSLGVFGIVYFKIKARTIVVGLGLLVVPVMYLQQDILMKLEKNRQDSSTDFAEHVQSISNIATDASNLERLNRWSCALKMFAERPVTGWGPGTYSFLYAPYQSSEDLTIISTNFGAMGNAHSEYLGALAETGIPGLIFFTLILFLTSFVALNTYKRLSNKNIKILILSAWLGLITYYSHAFLNNFLDLEKASVPFWGLTAIIAAINIFHTKKEENLPEPATK
jgi:putative inorganic carbon (hco3(-)) transporter